MKAIGSKIKYSNNLITLNKALLAASEQLRGNKGIAGGSSVENSPKWLQAGIDGGAWLRPGAPLEEDLDQQT